MDSDRGGGLRPALAWLIFPLVPALLGRTYHETYNPGLFSEASGPDPRDWSWLQWMLLAGPLFGYGFLAGATTELPDDPERRGLRSWFSRRAVWVAVGPWMGFLIAAAVSQTWACTESLLDSLMPEWRASTQPASLNWASSWQGSALITAFVILQLVTVGYGWVFVARAAMRRARRLGKARQAIKHGMAIAITFVGTLFGSFWAITEAWRSYFFDPRIAPLVVASLTLALLTGCASTVTYGELRRRELFAAMLTSWLLGLALLWRWGSRRRR
jgi:hypothetical protein